MQRRILLICTDAIDFMNNIRYKLFTSIKVKIEKFKKIYKDFYGK
jgi:hypothetical protein